MLHDSDGIAASSFSLACGVRRLIRSVGTPMVLSLATPRSASERDLNTPTTAGMSSPFRPCPARQILGAGRRSHLSDGRSSQIVQCHRSQLELAKARDCSSGRGRDLCGRDLRPSYHHRAGREMRRDHATQHLGIVIRGSTAQKPRVWPIHQARPELQKFAVALARARQRRFRRRLPRPPWRQAPAPGEFPRVR
jgi:hypothetical protein